MILIDTYVFIDHAGHLNTPSLDSSHSFVLCLCMVIDMTWLEPTSHISTIYRHLLALEFHCLQFDFHPCQRICHFSSHSSPVGIGSHSCELFSCWYMQISLMSHFYPSTSFIWWSCLAIQKCAFNPLLVAPFSNVLVILSLVLLLMWSDKHFRF